MSTISGVGSSASTYQAQSLQQQQPQRQRPAGPPPGAQEQFTSVAESFGLSSTEASSLFGEIDSVMQEAIESGASREDVQSSIQSILEENGIDADEFKAKMDEAFAASGQRPPRGQRPSFGGDNSSEDSSSIALSIADAIKNLPTGSFLDLDA
tara:strand:- start:15320 stop:15778 length:459 start_codon:yes stop_codon:yes gene_type:complete